MSDLVNKETRIAENVVYCEICRYWNVQNAEYKLGNCFLRMGEPTYDDDYCSKGCLIGK